MRKNITLWLLVISLIALGIGYILTNSVQFNLCLQNEYGCRESLNDIGDPLFYGMAALSIVFLILLFTPRAVSAWKKFAQWFVSLAALLFIFYPGPASGDYFSPYPEQIFQWVSGLYVIISLIIIGKAVLKDRRNSQTP